MQSLLHIKHLVSFTKTSKLFWELVCFEDYTKYKNIVFKMQLLNVPLVKCCSFNG